MTHVSSFPAGSPQKVSRSNDPIQLSVITSDTGPLAKKIWMGDRDFQKEAAAALSSGTAELVELDGLHKVPDLILSLGQNQALTTAIFDIPKCRIITEAKLSPDEYALGARARSKKYMRQPSHGLLLFDHDEGPYMPDRLKCSSAGELMGKLAVIPQLAGLMYCGLPSSSAGIRHMETGRELPSHGLHVYVPVKGVDLARFKAWLEVKLWQAGLSYISYARDGSLLLRHIVDLSVLSHERLIFEARPLLGPGLVQTPREFDLQPGRVLGDD